MNTGENRRFFKYVIPSIGAMLVSGLYFVVDGIFVGRGIGTDGLAAVNLSVPFISLLIAIPMMIAMGGASLTSISFGKGETERANVYCNTSIFMVLVFALSMSVIGIFFSEPIALLLGANQALLEDTALYLKYFVMFGVFFSGAMVLAAFVRNDGNPKLAFWGMTVGACCNVFLDWLFVFPLHMGLMGAAIASGLGQVLSCIILSFHFIFKKGCLRLAMPKMSIKEVGSIFKTGLPEFVTQMNSPITTFCYNQIVIRAFGEIGMAAFSVVAYLLTIILAVFAGLAQGIQPLLSESRGKGDEVGEKKYMLKGLITNIILSLLVYLVMTTLGKPIIGIFNSDAEMIRLAYESILVYGISFPFAAINIVYTTYYLSVKQTAAAMRIAVLRSFILNVACIFAVPALFGERFIWVGIAVAEALDTLFVLLNNLYIKKRKSYEVRNYQS
ncbi:MAG: MATE family efflux transporter [Candidatus Coproplasma sp.]